MNSFHNKISHIRYTSKNLSLGTPVSLTCRIITIIIVLNPIKNYISELCLCLDLPEEAPGNRGRKSARKRV